MFVIGELVMLKLNRCKPGADYIAGLILYKYFNLYFACLCVAGGNRATRKQGFTNVGGYPVGILDARDSTIVSQPLFQALV